MSETTPLLASPSSPKDAAPSSLVSRLFPPLRRVFFTSFLLSMTFAFTQTSLIYAFRIMTCDEYYKTHEWAPGGSSGAGMLSMGMQSEHGVLGLVGINEIKGDRCALPIIESATAQNIALMSSVTVWSTVINLFLSGYWLTRFGPKMCMFQQTIWAAMRNLCQIHALNLGGQTGMRIIQVTQLFNILGGGGGYQLAANAFIAVLVTPEARTGSFGVLGGIVMLGSSAGYTFGGMIDYYFGTIAPFQVTFCLLVSCTIFGSLFLPYVDPKAKLDGDKSKLSSASKSKTEDKRKKGFLAPIKVFMPRRVTTASGKTRRDWSLTLIGVGSFVSVLATGYVPMALQLTATNVFGFKPAETGMMLSLTLLVKAFFLSICFPVIISSGRKWVSPHVYAKPTSAPDSTSTSGSSSPTLTPGTPLEHPEDPSQAEPPTVISAPSATGSTPAPLPTDARHGSTWDLWFLKYSILLDGAITALVSMSNQGWHMYLAASILPFASGTGPASKGVVLDFVDADERAEALSAIALIEKVAQFSTIGVFGYVFSFLSELGSPTLVFAANGLVALLGFFVLLPIRMPPPVPVTVA